ncbi:syntaxin binding protein 6 (amisyn), like [Oryzias melastigma]|uniref:Syntaxin binding protein 6 (amisyn), like n=1 Tax=Oryzias melastigma TaxID=30732 RepID=A0A3B3C0K4_ORYME|nr:syntaxin binding protein 6 (amisyn), like [Oryzias melastigma]
MEKRTRAGFRTTMNVDSEINKQLFLPQNERLLVALEVQRRQKKRRSFLPTSSREEYTTFICVSVTNTSPHQLLITKVKQFSGSPSFTRRSQWTVEQLKQVNGINPNKDTPEFDLVFDNAVDQWVASSSPEKCIFIQVLYRACQTHWESKAGSLVNLRKLKASQQKTPNQIEPTGVPKEPAAPRTLQVRRKSIAPPRKTEFINCQSKLTRDASTMNLVIYRCKAFLSRVRKLMVARRKGPPRPDKGQTGSRGAQRTMGNVVHRMTVALGERGGRLTRAEDRTVKLMQKAQQLADTAHKLALKSTK